MATTAYYHRSYNQRQTYTINFYEHRIETTVTKDPQVVSAWIYKTEQKYHRHLKRLIVGLDTRWQRGKKSKVAVVQICVGRRCLIVQIMHSSILPYSLMKFMNNTNYTFTGVAVHDNVVKLRNEYGLGYEAQMKDLRSLAEEVCGPGSKKFGLKRLTALVLDHKVIEKPKHITLSSWGRYNLSFEQVEYACLDAFVSFEIARVLLAKARTIGDEPRILNDYGMYRPKSMLQVLKVDLAKYWRNNTE